MHSLERGFINTGPQKKLCPCHAVSQQNANFAYGQNKCVAGTTMNLTHNSLVSPLLLRRLASSWHDDVSESFSILALWQRRSQWQWRIRTLSLVMVEADVVPRNFQPPSKTLLPVHTRIAFRTDDEVWGLSAVVA